MSDIGDVEVKAITGTSIDRMNSDEVTAMVIADLESVKNAIANSVLLPNSSTHMQDSEMTIHKITEKVKKAFEANVSGTMCEKVVKLFQEKDYRSDLVKLTDLMLVLVDMAVEANVEMFEVEGTTKVLQEILRKCISFGDIQYSPG